MKREILRVLRETKDGFVSGQNLCEALGVTRQAIWKNITQLKEEGYQIESIPNRGYRLLTIPDTIYGPEIESRLPEGSLCRRVESHKCIDSTNIRARQLAEQGEPEGTLVVSEQQQEGKGRRGRGWSSDPGVGVWMTLLIRPAIRPMQATGITLITALAVTRAVRRLCQAPALIKWPNDVIISGKKICGILVEMSSEMDCIHYAIAGIGINVNNTSFPKEIEDKATSIRQQTGRKIDRQELVALIMEEFDQYYRLFLHAGDLSAVMEEYNQLLANRDKEVIIYHGMVEEASEDEIERGIAKGIDKEGALLVEAENEIRRIVSGEVSVRGVYGYV